MLTASWIPAFLPVLAAMGWVVGLDGREFFGRRLSFRDAVLLTGLLVALIALTGCWIASLASLLVPKFLIYWWLGWAIISGFAAWNALHAATKPVSPGYSPLRWNEWFVSGILGLILGAGFLMAVLSPPNNADSLIYHLPRQVFWMAQGTVFTDHVSNPHMIKMPPLSEYLGLNLFLLTGADRLHNLVQWFSLVGSLAAISRILSLVGATRQAQLVGALFFASIPAVFFEASNTKNDLVTTFFLLGAVWALTGAVVRGKFTVADAVFAGLFAGCALLTKGTAIAFMPVIGAMFLIVSWRRQVRLSGCSLAVAAIFTLVVASPHFLVQSGRIMNSERGSSSNHANSIIHPAAGASVLAQNLSLQFALPNDSWNRAIEKGAGVIADLFGVPVNDERTTFAGTKFGLTWHPEHEDRATALIHWAMLLLVPALAWSWVKPPLRATTLVFGATAILMVALFSLLFRWQPWHSRLLIPCMAVAAVGIGPALSFAGRGVVVASSLVWLAWLWPSLENSHRPLIGRKSILAARDEDRLRNIDVPADAEASRNLRAILRRLEPHAVGLHFPSGGIVYSVLRSSQRTDGSWPRFALSGENQPDVWLVKSVATEVRPDFIAPNWQRIALGGAWALWTSPAKTGTADAVVAPAAFNWPGAMRGVGEVQEPKPGYKLAAFRNLYAPEAVFESGPTTLPMALHLTVGSFAGPNRITVRANDQHLGEFKIETDGTPAEFDAVVPPQSAAFSIRVEFTEGYRSEYDPAPVAARLFRINFAPLSSKR